MNRRDFLKFCAAAGISAAIPLIVQQADQEIVFVDYELDSQLIHQAITCRGAQYKDGEFSMVCHLDMDKVWQAITLVSEDGRTWATVDGQRWVSGDCFFEVPA